MKSENEQMKAHLSQQGEKILLLEKNISELESLVIALKPTASCSKNMGNVESKKKRRSSPRASALPKTCQELRTSGHFADGVYLVINEETNKIEAIFCQFLTAARSNTIKFLEKLFDDFLKFIISCKYTADYTFVGNLDLKTQNVQFNVQRSAALEYIGSCNGCIPFEEEVLNIAEALDSETGSFTAPVTGTYHFEFSGIGEQNLQFYYYKNSLIDQVVAAPYVITSGSISFTASLRLEKGEKMIFQIVSGAFSSGIDGPSILYSGWLLEEELQLP